MTEIRTRSQSACSEAWITSWVIFSQLARDSIRVGHPPMLPIFSNFYSLSPGTRIPFSHLMNWPLKH